METRWSSSSAKRKWDIQGNEEDRKTASAITIRRVLAAIEANLKESDPRPLILFGQGDPSACFRTTPVAEAAIVGALSSANFNGYAPAAGIEPARRSIAEHLSCGLPYKLSANDVYLTAGAIHAIEVLIMVLGRIPGANNILLPRPGYPQYEASAAFTNLQVRHFDLLPDKGWEVDLDAVEALADDKTVAMVVINPGSPCGNVFTFQHMKKIAETAKKLGILVIADEVYDHLAFGSNPFVPMGVFGSITPIFTLGSISKTWFVPGWRLAWIATTDPNGILQKSGIVESLKCYLDITANPATFIQGAITQIIDKTTEDFFLKTQNIFREAANIFFDVLKNIPYLTCPHKPQGSMFTMVKINLSLLEDISDDMDFCNKLAKEESVVVMPGFAVGLKNWLRMTFCIERSLLEEGLERIKAFCFRHAKKQ